MTLVFVVLVFAIKIDGAEWSMQDNGLFGFLRSDNIISGLFLNSFMAGFLGVQGYTIALNYSSDLVVVNLLLLEPFGSQILGCYMGIDELPGFLTVAGLLTIMYAINLMHKGS